MTSYVVFHSLTWASGESHSSKIVVGIRPQYLLNDVVAFVEGAFSFFIRLKVVPFVVFYTCSNGFDEIDNCLKGRYL